MRLTIGLIFNGRMNKFYFAIFLLSCFTLRKAFLAPLIPAPNPNYASFLMDMDESRFPAALLFNHSTSKQQCTISVMKHWSFVREYFEDLHRKSDLTQAIRETIHQNECSKFIFLVQRGTYSDALKTLALELDATIEVYLVAPPLTMAHLFESATTTDSTKYFVVSTGDVAISTLDLIEEACKDAFNSSHLMVVSRRDNATNQDALNDCLQYHRQGSFDVYIGSTDLLHNDIFKSLVFSPSYWGVENLSAFVLAHHRVFNLCPYVDVVHYHSSRKDQKWRPRINSDSAVPLDGSEVCNFTMLKK